MGVAKERRLDKRISLVFFVGPFSVSLRK